VVLAVVSAVLVTVLVEEIVPAEEIGHAMQRVPTLRRPMFWQSH
jgi:hypothetical protein